MGFARRLRLAESLALSFLKLPTLPAYNSLFLKEKKKEAREEIYKAVRGVDVNKDR